MFIYISTAYYEVHYNDWSIISLTWIENGLYILESQSWMDFGPGGWTILCIFVWMEWAEKYIVIEIF